MRKFRFLTIVALLATFAFATSAFADSDRETFRGCMTGTNDNYVLRASDGTLYRLHSDKDINEHVNEMVEVKGKVENQKREKEAKRDVAAEQQAGIEIPKFGIDVHDIKTISKGCAALGAQNTASNSTLPAQTGEAASATTTTTTTTTVPAQAGVSAGVSTQAAPAAQAGAVAGAAGTTAGVAAGAAREQQMSDGKHFTGCLTGTEDNYLLRADDGSLYRLHSDKDIDEHVGKRVLVMGSIDNEQRERKAQEMSASEAAANVDVPKTGINVEDIKTISNDCTATPQQPKQ